MDPSARNKVASGPFKGIQLFGEGLDRSLTEGREKEKVLGNGSSVFAPFEALLTHPDLPLDAPSEESGRVSRGNLGRVLQPPRATSNIKEPRRSPQHDYAGKNTPTQIEGRLQDFSHQ